MEGVMPPLRRLVAKPRLLLKTFFDGNSLLPRSNPDRATRGGAEMQNGEHLMTLRANLTMAGLAGLIALSAGAATAKGPDHAKIFGEIDADGNGEITQAELTAHGEARFAKADTNGDGLLDKAEMMAARAERGGERSKRMLEKYDADGSGALDADELAKAAEERSGRRGNRMLKRLDANDDGKLSREEMTARRDPAKLFERLDADGNGTLSAEEFAKMAERGKRHRRHSN